MIKKLFIFRELWLYLKIRRKVLIFALVIFLILLTLLIVLAESPALAPFIYPL